MDKSHDRDDRPPPHPQAEGVRIIGAEEAQAALEAGQAAGRRPEDAPRFGDVPPPPSGPRSPHRFPLPDSVDPASAVPRSPVKPFERRFGGRFNRSKTPEPTREPAPRRVVRLVSPTESEGPVSLATEGQTLSAADAWPDDGYPEVGAAPAAPEPLPAEPEPLPAAPEPLPVGAIAGVGRLFEAESTFGDGLDFSGDPYFPRVAPGVADLAPSPDVPPDPLGAVAPWTPPAGRGETHPSLTAVNLDPPNPPKPISPYQFSGAASGGVDRPPPVAPDLSPPEEGINVHSGSVPDLPHWTDPPTGEVPFIRPEREPSQGEEMAAWQALGSRGLRWRDEASDWDDLDDVSDLAEDEARLGALDTTRTEHSDVYSFDEQFEQLEDERSGPAVVDPVLDAAPPAAPPRRTSGRRPPASRAPRRMPSGVAPNGGGRDLQSAVVVGVGMLVALLVAYYLGSAVLMLLSTVVVTASALELYNLMQHRGFRPATLLGVCATVAVMLAAYWRGEVSVPLILALVFTTSMLWYMLRVVDARPVVNVGLTVMTFVWIGVFGSYASLLLRGTHGKQLLLLPILVTVAADTAAYFAGSSIGSRPLAPAISPKKTWEGVMAGGIGAIVMSFMLSRLPFLSKTWSGSHALLLGLVVAVVAPIGDLCESMVKRDLDLKDSGSFLPGHGGMLDRFDALLFVLPATYYLALYLKLG